MAEVILTYTGKRIMSSGRLSHCLVDASGGEFFFKKLRGVYIGYRYVANQTEEGLSIANPPPEKGRHENQDDIDKWRAEESAACERQREESVKKRASSMKDLLEEIPKIKRFMSKLRGADRSHFMNWLWTEMEREANEAFMRSMNARFKRQAASFRKQLKRQAKKK